MPKGIAPASKNLEFRLNLKVPGGTSNALICNLFSFEVQIQNVPHYHSAHILFAPGGDASMKCPDVCVWGPKMYSFWGRSSVKKHTHVEGFLYILHTHIMV